MAPESVDKIMKIFYMYIYDVLVGMEKGNVYLEI